MFDWCLDFIEKFKNDKEISQLKQDKFNGNIKINFFEGKVVDVNKYQTRKPIA